MGGRQVVNICLHNRRKSNDTDEVFLICFWRETLSECYCYHSETALLQVGRIEKDYPFVDAHRAPCHEVAWSPFNDNVIASCSEDTTCKVS